MSSGFLIVTKYDLLYDSGLRSGRYDHNPVTDVAIYGLPHKTRPVPPPGMPKYRGIYRLAFEPQSPYLPTAEANEIVDLLDEVSSAEGRSDGWVTLLPDILRIWNSLGAKQSRYEIVFGREWQDATDPPAGAEFLGCDAGYFEDDHFSCICDALFLPRWHGCDPEGELFKEHFAKLNRHGLFNTNEQAMDYLQYYLSFDWTERNDNFTSIEVYAVQTP